MKILITGASGLIGKSLVKKLIERGHSVNILVRKKTNEPNEFLWNLEENSIEDEAFFGVESIIHLAGATIAKRWTNKYKKELYTSRIDTAKLLKKYALKHHLQLKSFISASGVNYYGTFTSNEILTEDTPIKKLDFLAELCKNWEEAAFDFSDISERIVCLRTSPVLAKKGGTFEPLKKITDLNLASAIGSGDQWMNWIHIDDLVELYVMAVENQEMNGSYNAVAEEIPSNKNFMKELARKSKKLFIPIPVPRFLIKLILGEMSTIILEGCRVSNQKIKSLGFEFQYPHLEETFENLLQK